MLLKLIRSLHIYSGLAFFTALVVFGLTGLAASFASAPDERPGPERLDVAFPVEANASPDALGKQAVALVGLPESEFALQTDGPEHELTVFLFGPNGTAEVKIDKSTQRATGKVERNSGAKYVSTMHEMLPIDKTTRPVKLWSLYMQLSTFALMFMSVSGVYLWLSTRPRLRWARISFTLGTVAVVALALIAR